MLLAYFLEVRVLHCVLISLALTYALNDDVPPEPKYKILIPTKGRKTSSEPAKELQNPWESGELFESDIMIPEDDGDRNGLEDTTKRWPNATLIYYIDKRFFSSRQLQRIQHAMALIEKKSCVRFRRYRKGDRAFLRVRGHEDGGCASFQGRLSGGQEVNLEPPDCLEGHGTILHELLHALGFAHQHSTPDRDEYIKIIWDNIHSGSKKNFQKQEKLTDFDVGYDYNSVMHYSAFAGSKNKKPTIEPLDKTARIGQRKGLSKKDIEKLNKMYGCVKKEKKERNKHKYKVPKPRTLIPKWIRHNYR